MAVTAGKAIAAIEGLEECKCLILGRGRGKGSGGGYDKPLFRDGHGADCRHSSWATDCLAASAVVSFQEDVFPILRGGRIQCHQPTGQGYEKSGLDLTTYEGLMKGTKMARWSSRAIPR